MVAYKNGTGSRQGNGRLGESKRDKKKPTREWARALISYADRCCGVETPRLTL